MELPVDIKTIQHVPKAPHQEESEGTTSGKPEEPEENEKQDPSEEFMKPVTSVEEPLAKYEEHQTLLLSDPEPLQPSHVVLSSNSEGSVEKEDKETNQRKMEEESTSLIALVGMSSFKFVLNFLFMILRVFF